MAEVTKEERPAMLTAMARECLGTGRWYTCENGHPFSIGEWNAHADCAMF